MKEKPEDDDEVGEAASGSSFLMNANPDVAGGVSASATREINHPSTQT
jgi:hypothetical protein